MALLPKNNEDVDTSTEPYLIDFQGDGEMLVICFGFYDASGNNKFDFFNRMKKIEMLSGRKINKLLLRDNSNSWYHNGIATLGENVAETVESIRVIIEDIKPSMVITIGQSMGGYAAIMYGALLGVDKVIAFGPLAYFDSEKLEIMRDYRWMPVVKQVEAAPPMPFYNNLPKLIAESSPDTVIEIFYGTNPGVDADRGEAVNYDAGHALAFSDAVNVFLFPVHNSPHAIVEYMRSNKIIDDVMINRLFGTAPDLTKDIGIGQDWTNWLQENIDLGCTDRQLIDGLVDNNFTHEDAVAALAAMHAKEDLKKICG